jgi:8-oxo-dGTP pyrophosphatase MutT (NUDIX family)
MTFETFINCLPNIVHAKLTGQESHKKFDTVNRNEILNERILQNNTVRLAAVMILLYPKNGQLHFLLIVRNSYEGVHSSQIAFPGGKNEDFDDDLYQTALRETFEEVGILPEKIKLIRELTSLYIPPSNFMVHPFMGYCEQTIHVIPNEREVSGIIEVPLELLNDESLFSLVTISNSYMNKSNVPALLIEGYTIWGATAMILSELKDILKNC